MHDRTVVIYCIEVVCLILPKVVSLVCMKGTVHITVRLNTSASVITVLVSKTYSPWCFPTEWKHSGHDQSGTARVQIPERALSHGTPLLTTYSPETAETQSDCLLSFPDMTSSYEDDSGWKTNCWKVGFFKKYIRGKENLLHSCNKIMSSTLHVKRTSRKLSSGFTTSDLIAVCAC